MKVPLERQLVMAKTARCGIFVSDAKTKGRQHRLSAALGQAWTADSDAARRAIAPGKLTGNSRKRAIFTRAQMSRRSSWPDGGESSPRISDAGLTAYNFETNIGGLL
jgi:hypothetical protein